MKGVNVPAPTSGDSRKVRVNHLKEIKRSGGKIAALTAYDFVTARLLDQAGIDIILVGDSVANVVLGYATTLPVTVEEMLHHAKAVARGVKRAMTVADMPFLSYQTGSPDAVRNAGRFLKESGVEAVKLEGAGPILETIQTIVRVGIPVMGHLGFTPQSVHRFGSQVVQGKTRGQAEALLEDALALEAAGVFAIVLECVPGPVARVITDRLAIPTIGIGAGPYCDGQILVFHDLVGLTPGGFRFVKRYAVLADTILQAVGSYVRDVREGSFPAAEHSFSMPAEEMEDFAGRLLEQEEA